MSKEFNLEDFWDNDGGGMGDVYHADGVKEFIKRQVDRINERIREHKNDLRIRNDRDYAYTIEILEIILGEIKQDTEGKLK